VRFAAALVAAFIAGYLFHARSIESDAGKVTDLNAKPAVTAEDSLTEPDPDWQIALAQAYLDEQSESRLARSWLALSKTLKDR
jgi:hypothetical protein